MKKGDFVTLNIESLAFGARGVAKSDDFVWFVGGGIPGQTVKAKILRLKKTYGEAIVHETLKPGPDQVDAPCPYFGVCGGCQLQHLKYEAQLEAKTRQVRELMDHIAGIESMEVRPTRPARMLYGYRNKMEFTFSDRPWIFSGEDVPEPKKMALGLHVAGRFDKVVDIDRCLLMSETANRLFIDLKSLLFKTELPPYRIRDHQGFWRFLVIREGRKTGDLLMQLITSSQAPEQGKPAFDWLMHKLFWNHLELTSVIHGISDRKAQDAFPETEILILGDGRLHEKIGSCMFGISSNAFFQTNTDQTKILFDTVLELCDFSGNEIVYDLYCGTGAIGIYLAGHVGKVIGIEAIPSAVEDGRRNVELNALGNVQMIEGDMMNALNNPEVMVREYGQPDAVIIDPPRGGMHPNVIGDLLALNPSKIIYISCNPPILARDLAQLQTAYTIYAMQPVDMFPHTKHIEVVCVLHRK